MAVAEMTIIIHFIQNQENTSVMVLDNIIANNTERLPKFLACHISMKIPCDRFSYNECKYSSVGGIVKSQKAM